ncbi:hypothetical protein L1I30_04295 [Gillisia sp. M10.2A]|uniref:Secreted protein n=1 Tax=Gillisia lutea TaxID=2909668 RepID=A0ABS9EDC2_9FLAO|nr:hypothetical protein [Gillisia lutea]MCF4100879.1 hypothetical protein [Gillisia lutea]
MKSGLHRSISVALAFLVLVSTFSFSIDKHFCGSILVDQAVFSKAKSCGMEMKMDESSSMASLEKDSCCSNEKVSIDGQDELKLNFDSLDLQQQIFVASYTYTYLNLFEVLPKQVTPFDDYSPPLLVTDIQVLDQVFLI